MALYNTKVLQAINGNIASLKSDQHLHQTICAVKLFINSTSDLISMNSFCHKIQAIVLDSVNVGILGVKELKAEFLVLISLPPALCGWTGGSCPSLITSVQGKCKTLYTSRKMPCKNPKYIVFCFPV